MGVFSEFEHTITVTPAGRDKMGKPQSGASRTVPACKIAPGNTLEDVQDNADLDRALATLYAPPGTRLDHTDRITITDGPCVGVWELDGDPQYWHSGTVAVLKKYGN